MLHNLTYSIVCICIFDYYRAFHCTQEDLYIFKLYNDMWSPINSNFIPVISSQLYDEGPDVPVDGSVVSVGESV